MYALDFEYLREQRATLAELIPACNTGSKALQLEGLISFLELLEEDAEPDPHQLGAFCLILSEEYKEYKELKSKTETAPETAPVNCCVNCWTNSPDHFSFCPECGTSLNQ